MIRSIDTYLENWKDRASRKPLILRGARQVGKTFSIRAFGARSFKNTVLADFEQRPQLRAAFEQDLDVRRIVSMLELEFGDRIIPGETLLLLDEIQHCPRALASLRYFLEDMPELHVIAAGSMLEFQMGKISFPVGRVESKFMYPMTFEEFLLNTGNERLNSLRPKLGDTEAIPGLAHTKFLEELRRYFVVGGMPEAVQALISTGSYIEVEQVHRSLCMSYIQDILKHEKNLELEALSTILEAIPRQVGIQIKYSKLCTGLSTYKAKQALSVLGKSLIIHPVHSSGAHGLPLGGDVNKSVIKAVFLDIGLMQHICGLSASAVLAEPDLLSTYHGALCEQFIGQELMAAGGSQNEALYYWSRAARNSNAEVDYLRVSDGEIRPLEIKRGPAGKLRSLHLFLDEHPGIPHGYVLNSGNVGAIGRIRFRPLYTQL